jgi:LPXTG-motif cell wall-anchored protein
VVDGPATDAEISESITIGIGGGQTAQTSATVTAAACTGPAAPPGIAFTFTNDPSVPVAEVGETVAYSFCGRNNSDVPLEVVRVVDDRYGELELPDIQTIVQPGQSFCNTDIALEVTYEIQPTDQGTTIINNAVVTVRTVGAEPQAFQAADPAEVDVPAAAERVEPVTTNLPVTALAATGSNTVSQSIAAGFALASGALMLAIGRRRSTN